MGGDIMTFPDTVEEFMEQYKMVDREQIYSNGCEYVPIFRMKQWFDHKPQIDLVRCGECRHSATDDVGNTFCMWLGALRRPTDFCSYGERKGTGVKEAKSRNAEEIRIQNDIEQRRIQMAKNGKFYRSRRTKG